MMRAMRKPPWLLFVTLAAAAPFLQGSSCIPNIKPSVDEVTATMQNAIDALGQQSASWQATLQDLQQKLAQNASDLANQVAQLAQRGLAYSGVEVQCRTDIVGTHMRNALINLLHTFKHEPLDPVPPTICQVIPDNLDYSHLPDALRFTGADLDDTDKPLAVAISDSGEKSVPATYVNRVSNYVMTLNVQAMKDTGLLTAQTRQVVFRWHGATVSNEIGVIAGLPPVVQCGAVGQTCCSSGAQCTAAGATCVSGTCRQTMVLTRGVLCGLGHTDNAPHPTCAGHAIQQNAATNGNCPAGYGYVEGCDMGAPSGHGYFGCMLLEDTRVSELPAGLVCGFGHTGMASPTCAGRTVLDGQPGTCPNGYQYVFWGDNGMPSGQGWFGCALVSAQAVTSSTTVPSGTVCGFSHTCRTPSACASNSVTAAGTSCPAGYTHFGPRDENASSGQGLIGCMKL